MLGYIALLIFLQFIRLTVRNRLSSILGLPFLFNCLASFYTWYYSKKKFPVLEMLSS